jgi:DEAD/DEAH box helicase domain-containing protein
VKFGRGGKENSQPVKVDGFLPAQVFPTESFWLTIPVELLEKVAETIKSNDPKEVEEKLSGGLHAIEHALVAMLPRIVDCDPNDVGGLSSLKHKATEGLATVFVYDNFAGGVGFAKTCFEKFGTLVGHCINLMESCRCRESVRCPSCIQTSKCGMGNKPLDKGVALALLKELQKI